MHKYSDTPIAEHWCSLICFRGDCLFPLPICYMYVLAATCELVIEPEYFTASVTQKQVWRRGICKKPNKAEPSDLLPVPVPTLCRHVNIIISDVVQCTVSFVYAVNRQ